MNKFNPFNEGSFRYLLFELEQRPRDDLVEVGTLVDILKTLGPDKRYENLEPTLHTWNPDGSVTEVKK